MITAGGRARCACHHDVMATPTEPVPARVRDLVDGRAVTRVWRNELGGLTFHDPVAARFVKVSPPHGPDLTAERDRLDWLHQVAPELAVPGVVSWGEDADGSWLVTAALPGRSAVDPHWRDRPDVAGRAIGRALRRLHDRLPAGECPFDWTVPARLAFVPGAGRQDPRRWHEDLRHLTATRAVELVRQPPPIDRLVVCHGDPCVPNTLLSDDGAPSGLVDLGRLGVADRWADLAVATWSMEWNFGPGQQQHVLDGYEIDPDPDRTAYYRLLWDLSVD